MTTAKIDPGAHKVASWLDLQAAGRNLDGFPEHLPTSNLDTVPPPG